MEQFTSPCNVPIIVPIPTRGMSSLNESPICLELYITPTTDRFARTLEDSPRIQTQLENSPCPPIKSGFTPYALPQWKKGSQEQNMGSPMIAYDQNHLEKTPSHGPKILLMHSPNPMQCQTTLDFSAEKTKIRQIAYDDEEIDEDDGSYGQIIPVSKRVPGCSDNSSNSSYKLLKNEEEEQAPKGRKARRSQKNSDTGLKALSLAVVEITKQLKKVTYKELATHLVNKLVISKKIASIENTRQIQNAKRRVYDALNVLVASNVLWKQHKYLSLCAPNSQNYELKAAQIKEVKNIKDAIAERKKQIHLKVTKMMELRQKYTALANLKARNKAHELLNPHKKQQIIKFPFVVFTIKKDVEYQVLKRVISDKEERITIRTKAPYQIFPDVDAVMKLGIPQMCQNLLSKELEQFFQKTDKYVKGVKF